MGMQRPSDLLFDGGLLQQFRESRIVAVFNLTQKGEHPYCGYGIIPATGFSYSPEKLMNAGSESDGFILIDKFHIMDVVVL